MPGRKRKPPLHTCATLLAVTLWLIMATAWAADTTPTTQEGQGGQPAPGGGLRQSLSSPDGAKLFNLQGGGEMVNRRLGLRLGGDATWYTADKRQGLRLDAAMVQGDARRELLRLLLSAGSRLGEDSQVVASAGWLNRYAWGNYGGVGDQGDHLNQYVLGLEVERRLRQRSNDLLPGVSASLSGLYFKSDSKTVWSGYQTFESGQAYTTYLSEYGLAGGSQLEAMAGVELAWRALSLELRAGLRHKEYEEYLGRAGQSQDAPKLAGRLTLHDLWGCELSGFYTWDPDLKVLGAEARRQLWGPLGLLARAEQVSGAERPDDTRVFLGLDFMLGDWSASRGAGALPGVLARAQEERQAVQVRQEAYVRGDWLRPVRGSEVEYVQVMRQVQRQTRISEVPKAGQAPGVSINGQGEMVFGGLPPLSAIVAVRPVTASPAFHITGGQLRASLASLPAPADIIVQAQQTNGLYSMVRLRTSRGSVVVDSTQYGSNLDQCQASQILGDPNQISNPPLGAGMGKIPDQHVGFMAWFSINLTGYATGSGVNQFELLGALPPGMSFNPATGQLAGRPSRGGTYNLAVRALGTCGWSNYSTFALIVEDEPVGSGGGGN